MTIREPTDDPEIPVAGLGSSTSSLPAPMPVQPPNTSFAATSIPTATAIPVVTPSAPIASAPIVQNDQEGPNTERTVLPDGSVELKITSSSTRPDGFRDVKIEYYKIPASLVAVVDASPGSTPSSLYLTKVEQHVLPPGTSMGESPQVTPISEQTELPASPSPPQHVGQAPVVSQTHNSQSGNRQGTSCAVCCGVCCCIIIVIIIISGISSVTYSSSHHYPTPFPNPAPYYSPSTPHYRPSYPSYTNPPWLSPHFPTFTFPPTSSPIVKVPTVSPKPSNSLTPTYQPFPPVFPSYTLAPNFFQPSDGSLSNNKNNNQPTTKDSSTIFETPKAPAPPTNQSVEQTNTSNELDVKYSSIGARDTESLADIAEQELDSVRNEAEEGET